MTEAPKTAAAYIRVSTEDQLEYSPESQLRVIRDYAGKNGFFIPDKYIFTDEGISGRRAEKRPAFMEMIAVAKTRPRPFEAILLWKFSRFARNRRDSIVYKSMLRRQLGIEVLSVSENLGDDKISVLIEALIEAMDEYYSINLAEEVRRGMTEKARRGEPLSIPPFGYRLENKELVPVPGEAEIVRSVFAQYADGKAPARIAKTLNFMGVLTHRGGKIEGRTVEYWLNNPVYIGKIRWTPTGKTRRDFHNPDSIVSEGSHEPIIDSELWQFVQDRLSSSAPKMRTGRRELSHWLVGLVRCGHCGGPMVNCRGYFYCGNKSRGLCTGDHGIRAADLADSLIIKLRELSQRVSPVSAVPRQRSSGSSGEAQLKNALRRLQRIKDAYKAGIDTLEEYRAEKARLTAEIELIKSELNTPAEENMSSLPACIADIFSDGDLSNERKNSVLRSIVRRITLTREIADVELIVEND